MNARNTVGIKENDILQIDPDLLSILLKDKTTGKNIIWATDNYSKYGFSYSADKEIKIELITSCLGGIIKPRIQKSKEERQQRVRQKAEVFTPSWICNLQANVLDESWFGRKNVFNVEKENGWKATKEKIFFAGEKGKDWQDYVLSNRMEITCGEAPYITSRYDMVTGEYIEVPNRIGLLDRKLRVVSENTETHEDWIKWATSAVQSSYGYEWQGDSLLIARENVLFTIAEHYEYKFSSQISMEKLKSFAEIIAWNFWQMDGLKFVIPNSCCTKEVVKEDLFERRVISEECEGCKLGYGKNADFKHNGIYCKIKDWKENEILRFVDLLKKGEKK